MKIYRIVMTPNCTSRFAWLARARWCLAAFYVRLAFYAIDAAMLLSDDFDMECHEEEVPE